MNVSNRTNSTRFVNCLTNTGHVHWVTQETYIISGHECKVYILYKSNKLKTFSTSLAVGQVTWKRKKRGIEVTIQTSCFSCNFYFKSVGVGVHMIK